MGERQTARLLTSSYLAFKPGSGVAVAISLGKPKWPLAYEIAAELGELKPFGLLTTPRLPADEFRGRYLDRLEAIGVDRIRAGLDRIAAEHGKPLVLLCWEKPGGSDPCHRWLFAEWWQAKTGEEVPEL